MRNGSKVKGLKIRDQSIDLSKLNRSTYGLSPEKCNEMIQDGMALDREVARI